MQHVVPRQRKEPEEPPLAFCGRLCGVAKKWTNLDPEDEANQKMFNVLFIGQLSQDVSEWSRGNVFFADN